MIYVKRPLLFRVFSEIGERRKKYMTPAPIMQRLSLMDEFAIRVVRRSEMDVFCLNGEIIAVWKDGIRSRDLCDRIFLMVASVEWSEFSVDVIIRYQMSFYGWHFTVVGVNILLFCQM